MKLVYATFFLAAAAVGVSIALIGARDPRKPAWASDFLVADVYSIAVLGALAAGFGLLLQSLWNSEQSPPRLVHVGLAAAVAVAAAVVVKTLRIKKRLAGFAALGEAQGSRPPESPDDGRPVEPAGTERRRLAA